VTTIRFRDVRRRRLGSACVAQRVAVMASASASIAVRRGGARALRSNPGGFTLIEVLVVLVIAAVLVATLTLAIGASGTRELENAARRSQRLITLACERAVLSGRDIGFAALGDGLHFGYYEPEGWRELREDPGEELRVRPWGEGVDVQLEREDEPLPIATELPAQPPFACLSSGELTPLRIEFTRPDVAARWRLEGSIDGTLALAEVGDAR
jgi:type II secretion system protein H